MGKKIYSRGLWQQIKKKARPDLCFRLSGFGCWRDFSKICPTAAPSWLLQPPQLRKPGALSHSGYFILKYISEMSSARTNPTRITLFRLPTFPAVLPATHINLLFSSFLLVIAMIERSHQRWAFRACPNGFKSLVAPSLEIPLHQQNFSCVVPREALLPRRSQQSY